MLLAVAGLGWAHSVALLMCLPCTSGHGINLATGREVFYVSILDLKRIEVYINDTPASALITAVPPPPGQRQGLLAYSAHWDWGPWLMFMYRSCNAPLLLHDTVARTEVDGQALVMLELAASYLEDAEWQQRDGVRYGLTAEGKAQLLRNMLEVLRRKGDSSYLNRMVVADLLRPLDHPAGPADVPSARQLIRKAAQYY